MANILILGGGTQGLAMIRSVRRNGHRVFLLTDEKDNYAGRSRYLNGVREFCVGKDSYPKLLEEMIRKESIDAIIPTGDGNAEYLSMHREELQPLARYEMPCHDDFLKGYDKRKLMDLCAEKGYPHPYTVDLSSMDVGSSPVRDFPYPAMLKPDCTTGGRGMRKIDTYEELVSAYPELREKYGEYHLQRFIEPGGRQMKVQLYVDEAGDLLQSSVIRKRRWYPVEGGSCSCAVSDEAPEMVEVCHQILKDIHWAGFADFDLIEDPQTKTLLIMEMNPRVPACIKGAMAAGMDWGEIIVNGYLGLPQKEYTYRTGVVTRHLGFEALWFLHSEKRWSKDQHWFRFFGKDIHYQDMSDRTDPLPFLFGTFRNVRKVFSHR